MLLRTTSDLGRTVWTFSPVVCSPVSPLENAVIAFEVGRNFQGNFEDSDDASWNSEYLFARRQVKFVAFKASVWFFFLIDVTDSEGEMSHVVGDDLDVDDHCGSSRVRPHYISHSILSSQLVRSRHRIAVFVTTESALTAHLSELKRFTATGSFTQSDHQ